MHVLDAHDVDGSDGLTTVSSAAESHDDGELAGPEPAELGLGPVVLPTDAAAHGMAACVLFLVIGGSLVLLALLGTAHERTPSKVRRPQLVPAVGERAPPSGRTRVSLSVLRV
jgi:hypothetical protein